MLNPAFSIITMCGGADAVADIVGRSVGRVYRWMHPRDRGGTGGLVPADCQQVLLDGARARGIDLRPEHFFLQPPHEDAA